jgi:aquaporin Z
LVAEFFGTFALVFIGAGSAVFGLHTIGAAGVALAFGFVMLAMVYAIGPVSGAHINPAVTLGVFLRGGIDGLTAAVYVVVQVIGAILAGAFFKLLTSGFGAVSDNTGTLGANDWGKTISGGGTFVLEIILTTLFVFVVLLTTSKMAISGFAGLAIGLALGMVHLVGVPLDGTSVNPARSLGPALWEGGQPLARVWMFIVAPLIGGVIAAALAWVLEGRPTAAPASPLEPAAPTR